jgi:hypothetical protein
MPENSAHAKEWTERRARYLAEPNIEESESWLEINANDPRPLANVLDALARQHGWHINYEDPQYAKADILDDTAPSWLREHPNGQHVYVVGGAAFSAKIAVDGRFTDDPMKILPALVEAYNRSGNPGHFELRTTTNHEWFAVVPTAAGDGPQTPILDTMMSFNVTNSVNINSSLRAFCDELTRQSGQTVEFWRGFSTGTPQEHETIKLHAQSEPAREVLRQILDQGTSFRTWRLLYDPDLGKFHLMLR